LVKGEIDAKIFRLVMVRTNTICFKPSFVTHYRIVGITTFWGPLPGAQYMAPNPNISKLVQYELTLKISSKSTYKFSSYPAHKRTNKLINKNDCIVLRLYRGLVGLFIAATNSFSHGSFRSTSFSV